MRAEPIRDHDGDLIAAQEQHDRALERADSPLTHLDIRPLEPCRVCGQMAREVEPSRWVCACDGLGVAA